MDDEIIKIAKSWAVDTSQLLSANAPRDTGELAKSIKGKVRKFSNGDLAIGFSIKRYGVFVHKGVGRGRGIANPHNPRPFFNSVINKELRFLVDDLAQASQQAVINASRILIQNE
jgi:hypothetical protein